MGNVLCGIDNYWKNTYASDGFKGCHRASDKKSESFARRFSSKKLEKTSYDWNLLNHGEGAGGPADWTDDDSHATILVRSDSAVARRDRMSLKKHCMKPITTIAQRLGKKRGWRRARGTITPPYVPDHDLSLMERAKEADIQLQNLLSQPEVIARIQQAQALSASWSQIGKNGIFQEYEHGDGAIPNDEKVVPNLEKECHAGKRQNSTPHVVDCSSVVPVKQGIQLFEGGVTGIAKQLSTEPTSGKSNTSNHVYSNTDDQNHYSLVTGCSQSTSS